MRGRVSCSLVIGVGVVVATLHATASAQGLEALRVERAPGAEECPDSASLSDRIVAIRGHADTPNNGNYEVSFTHTADTFSATIRSGMNGGSQRVLEARSQTCAALAQATAVTLALLFDAVAEEAPPPEPKPAPPPAPPKVENPLVEPIVLEPPRARHRVDNTFSMGVAGVAYVLRPLAPALVAELGLRVDTFRVGLGVLWTPTQSLSLDPGHVDESLLSGTARTCLSLTRGQRLQLDICSGLFAGAVTARSEGFTHNARRVRSWLTVPLELSVADLSGSFGWELSASALGALVHQDFEVDGLGVAYRAPRVGAMLTLRGVGLLTW